MKTVEATDGEMHLAAKEGAMTLVMEGIEKDAAQAGEEEKDIFLGQVAGQMAKNAIKKSRADNQGEGRQSVNPCK